MARIGETGDLAKCSFCGKSQRQVLKLVAGPGVYICNECVDLCCEIFEDDGLLDPRQYRRQVDPAVVLNSWIDTVERRETVKLVTEAKTTLEQLLSLLDLQQSREDSEER